MKKLLLLLALSFLSVQSFAESCPDGSDPLKSISADGTYYVFSCVEQASSSQVSSSVNTTEPGTVSLTSLVQKSTASGNWFPTDGSPMYSPHYAKQMQNQHLRKKSYLQTHFGFADFDGDGIEDFFIVTNPKQAGVDWTKAGPNCETDLGDCYSDQGAIFTLEY